jgi:hypothetical protein
MRIARSSWTFSRRNWCSQAMVPSTTERVIPKPLPVLGSAACNRQGWCRALPTFGDSGALRARTWLTQKQECYLRVLTYNVISLKCVSPNCVFPYFAEDDFIITRL